MYKYKEPEPTPPIEPKPAKPSKPSRTLRLRAVSRTLASVGVGMLIMLGALFAYNALNPSPAPLTERQVQQLVARAMASATAPPPDAVGVYQAIEPAIVRIETNLLTTNGKTEGGVGTGVIIDQSGNILTSLHVVQQAINIQVTFYDGTQSDAAIAGTEPDQDIAVLHPSHTPDQVVPAILGN